MVCSQNRTVVQLVTPTPALAIMICFCDPVCEKPRNLPEMLLPGSPEWAAEEPLRQTHRWRGLQGHIRLQLLCPADPILLIFSSGDSLNVDTPKETVWLLTSSLVVCMTLQLKSPCKVTQEAGLPRNTRPPAQGNTHSSKRCGIRGRH